MLVDASSVMENILQPISSQVPQLHKLDENMLLLTQDLHFVGTIWYLKLNDPEY